jgi:hypothetical protein
MQRGCRPAASKTLAGHSLALQNIQQSEAFVMPLLHERLLDELPENWRQLISRGISLTLYTDRVILNIPDGARFTDDASVQPQTLDTDAHGLGRM